MHRLPSQHVRHVFVTRSVVGALHSRRELFDEIRLDVRRGLGKLGEVLSGLVRWEAHAAGKLVGLKESCLN